MPREFQWGEVDGVPTLWAAPGTVQGPLQACLIVGVGRSDETIVTSGITHIVEHLALQPLAGKPYACNGSVGTVATRFQVVGGSEEVAGFLGSVAGHLSRLPLDRLADEARVLQIEGERGGAGQL